MTQQISYSKTSPDQTINSEQFTQIIDAILAGKYSWACFLLLRCLGYNPLHYIPYRTYHRLVQEHTEVNQSSKPVSTNLHPTRQAYQTQSNGTYAGKQLTQITDLAYLEQVSDSHPKVRGGHANPDLESSSTQVEGILSKIQGFFGLNH